MRIGHFEAHQRAQRLRVVIEAARPRERGLERILASMAEGRMANIVRQAERLGQILVDAERPRNRAADLRHFKAVRQPDAEMIAIGREKYLRLVAQPAKGDRVDDPIAIALEGIARPPGRATRFGMQPAAALRRMTGIGRKRHFAGNFSTASPAALDQTKPSTLALSRKSRAALAVVNGPISRRFDLP